VASIVLFGAGDIARLAHFYFTTDSPHEVVAFTVDSAYCHSEVFQGLPLVPFEGVVDRYPPSEYAMFVALSYARMNQLRAEKYQQAKACGYSLVNYVSSRCSFLTREPIGDNCFILEDNTIQPFVLIGDDVTLWSGNHIGHDASIGDHTFISSHVVVSGHVQVGRRCFLGVNATLRNSIQLGDDTLVGAGAVVMKSTKPKSVYLGSRSERWTKTSDQVEL
jgi:sugar O-acyltransferase (sialic acid O-acetyltransferase NeuD family)